MRPAMKTLKMSREREKMRDEMNSNNEWVRVSSSSRVPFEEDTKCLSSSIVSLAGFQVWFRLSESESSLRDECF
jgi:hypothetical protein